MASGPSCRSLTSSSSYSRAFILRAYPQQTHEMLFDAHNHAFRVLGGVPRRGIYDNMRTAVDKVGRGKERQVNARFSAMVSHFLFEAEFCNPASGWEKGQIEKNVQDARHRLWQPTPSFPSLAALNDWLETRCQELWAQTPHGSHPGMISDAWSEEAQHLMPLPRPFDGFVEYAKRVSPTCLIHLERNRYSVPASFANRPVSVRVYPERIVVAGEGQVICEHRRVFARSHQRKSTTTVFDWRHYLAVIQRKPGALRNGAPFAELPLAFRALQQRMLKTPGGDREMVEILALVLQHDEQAVLAAVELASGGWRADQDAYSEPAAPVGRRQADRPAVVKAACSDAHLRAAGQRRTLRCAAQSPGGASCVIIPPLAPSSSCCEPSRCTVWLRRSGS